MSKLKETYICLDCDEVFVGSRQCDCPACGSQATAPLSVWVQPLGPIVTAQGTSFEC